MGNNYGWYIPGLMLTLFSNPAAFVKETPVDQLLDFLGVILGSRLIDGPRTDSESKNDLLDGSPLRTEGERFFGGRGALKDLEMGEGRGGDVKRSDLVGVGIRVR